MALIKWPGSGEERGPWVEAGGGRKGLDWGQESIDGW